jgi:hypothetical protein
VSGSERTGSVAARRDQLLGEERIALAARVDRVGQRSVGAPPDDALRLVADLIARERCQVDPLHAARGEQLCEERSQRMAAVQLVAAVGDDEQQTLVAHAARQEEQQVPRGAIGPMQVLDHDRERLLFGKPLEDSEQELEQPRLADRAQAEALRAWDGASSELREQTDHLAAGLAEDSVELVVVEVAGEVAQRRDDRRERDLTLAQLDALAREGQPAVERDPLGERVHEPALADAGLAGDHDHAGCALGGSFDRRFERRQLRASADQLRARNA